MATSDKHTYMLLQGSDANGKPGRRRYPAVSPAVLLVHLAGVLFAFCVIASSSFLPSSMSLAHPASLARMLKFREVSTVSNLVAVTQFGVSRAGQYVKHQGPRQPFWFRWGNTRSISNSATVKTAASTDVPIIDAEEGMMMVDRDDWKFLDLRDAKAYDDEHLTKPPLCSVNVPLPTAGTAALPAAVEAARLGRSQKLLIACADGSDAVAAAAELAAAGWTTAAVRGGYAGWRNVWTTSGRKVPPKGRWVPTGTESLKSALNIGDAAMSYEEKKKDHLGKG